VNISDKKKKDKMVKEISKYHLIYMVLPAQMRATTDDKFHTSPKMPRATAFL